MELLHFGCFGLLSGSTDTILELLGPFDGIIPDVERNRVPMMHAKESSSHGEATLGSVSPEIPAQLLRVAMNIKLAREDRSRHLPAEMFGEAAWDMILALYIARGRGYRLKVSDACYESQVPTTTALRWLDYLDDAGLMVRCDSSMDRRKVMLDITSKGIAQLNTYLGSVRKILSHF